MLYAIHCSDFANRKQWISFDQKNLISSSEWRFGDRVHCRCVKVSKSDDSLSLLCYVSQDLEDAVILKDDMTKLNNAIINFFKNQNIERPIKTGDMLRYYDNGSARFYIRPVSAKDGKLGWEVEYE